jgi:ABC-type branched-subunit amino acid transport system ATPase component/ABC-type branched-subunit amino acid transport system permease subunit
VSRRPSLAQATSVVLFAAALIAVVLIAHRLPADSSSTGRFQTPAPVIVLGVIQGMTYGLLAMGLVLIYRTNRIINFAHGQIGVLAAALFALAATRWHIPYWVALPLALIVGAAVGAVAETGVIRRLRGAPRLMSVVATLGVGQFLGLLAFSINTEAGAGALFPQPTGMPAFTIGELQITPAYSGMLFLSPLLALGLALFLRRSRQGLGIRAAAANPDGARLAGIFSSRMSSLTWGLAGALSAFTAILTQPTQGLTSAESFGPGLLLRALTAAALAGMTSMPRAMVAGVAVGVVEQTVFWNYPQSGIVEVTLFALTMLALLWQRIGTGRDEDKRSDWSAVQALRPIPAQLRRHWLVRRLGIVTGLVALLVATILPAVVTTGAAATLTGIFAVAVVGLSVGLLTGLSGHLTLGQFAVAAVGATVSYYVSRQTGNFLLAFLCAGLVAGVVSVILGLPALRSRGLLLTVTTLSFAIIVPVWLLRQPFALGDGVDPGRPVVAGHVLDSGRGYYYFALAVLIVAFVVAGNVRRSGFGRQLIAVRDNEDAARAFSVNPARVKWQSYLLAGSLAGLGGATYGHSLSSINFASFPAQASLDLVVMTVIGGISLLAGPLLGALVVIGVPAFVPLDSAGLAATAFGQLLIILYLPRGLVQLVEPARDLVVRRIAGRAVAPPAVTTVRETRDLSALQSTRSPLREGPLLEAVNLTKRFGGVTAVDGVSFEIHHGETVGLIGPNGAGKTTTFELLGGFTKPDSGAVYFDDRDITRMRPEQRARLGLIRSFQDAGLFPTMTVRDAVALSLERAAPTRTARSVLGIPDRTRSKDRRVRELIGTMGLDGYRDKQIQELSTGIRRITELTCLIGLDPAVLLLDEPSSGIAQRESEALGRLLRDLAAELRITMVVIEHDIPLIMGLADRIIAMDTGQVIADGTPAAVRANPRVIESYLGTGTYQGTRLASGA